MVCKSHHPQLLNTEATYNNNILTRGVHPTSNTFNPETRCEHNHCNDCYERTYHKLNTPSVISSYSPDSGFKVFDMKIFYQGFDALSELESQACKKTPCNHQRKLPGTEILKTNCVLLI